MLISFKTSIKTSILLLLFTTGISFSYAGSCVRAYTPEIPPSNQINGATGDTIQQATTIQNEKEQQTDIGIIKDSLLSRPIKFQINSGISYLQMYNFRKDEARELFSQALQKENEVIRLSTQTDSLRKAYINSSSDQKAEVARLILKSEQKSIDLNEEIPSLYEKARNIENQYWQSASTDEIALFQEKIALIKDSMQKSDNLKNEQKTIVSQKALDTITFYPEEKTTNEKSENPSEIVYKIQLGSFKSKVPDAAMKSIKKLSILRKVETTKDEKGLTIYTTGNLKSYQEALIMQSQVKQEGMKNPIITAYQKGKKITLEEARKINKEL